MVLRPKSGLDLATSAVGPATAPLAEAFADAISLVDTATARALAQDATVAGFGAGRLYTELIRPAMVERLGGPADVARLSANVSLSVLADALEAEPAAPGHGVGRAALVVHGDSVIQALDGEAVSAFLSWSGWRVGRLRPEIAPHVLSDLDRGGAVELVVVVVDSAADVAALESVCTTVRRVADPPVIVLADLAGGVGQRPDLLALGADDVVVDPMALLSSASARSPVPGRRRWGVRLLRSGDTLTVAPTGSLDAVSVDRLADIATTRAGSFRRLVIDLRDLSDIDASGVDGLLEWPDRVPCGDIARELLVDGAVRRALARATVAGWTLSEPSA